MDQLFAMEALLRAVERGGFAPVAREWGVTPSALSKAVAKLERRLGVKLLHRTTRRLRPTAEGEAYLERAARIVAAVREADAEAVHHGGRPSGRLRMVVGMSFGAYALVPSLPEFLDRHPEIDLDLVMGERTLDPTESSAARARTSSAMPRRRATTAWRARRSWSASRATSWRSAPTRSRCAGS